MNYKDKLSELNDEMSESSRLLSHARRLKGASEILAKHRLSGRSLSSFIQDIPSPHQDYNKFAHQALCTAIDELSHDIFRITEMRLAAEERTTKFAGQAKALSVQSAIIPGFISIEKKEV